MKETVKSVSLREMAEGRKDYFQLDPRIINVQEGLNPRQEFGDLTELKGSIVQNGVRNPLRVFIRDGKIWLSHGERRLRSVMELISEGQDIKTVPVIPEERGISEEQLVVQALIDNSGLPLSQLEEANAVVRLLNWGWTPQSVAQKTGRSLAHISNLKALVNLPKEVTNEIEAGNISPTFAVDLARQFPENPEKLVSTIKEAKEKAKELGKTKVTKKIATEGTTRKTSQKSKQARILEILDLAIWALKDAKTEEQRLTVLQDIQEFRDAFAQGKFPENKEGAKNP